jgi:PTH1 family peptidyl-tRNA hydrolase
MKLIVGLGNPGRKYEGTRHNLGYAVLVEIAKRLGIGTVKKKFEGELAETFLDGEKLLLLSPTTYMNLSGTSVRGARDFFGLSNDQLLVVCDDLNLAVGKVRLRASGSAGGQKGLADVIRKLATEEFPRLRVGIGQVPPQWDAADFVLSKFNADELPLIEQAVVKAADAVAVWVREGLEASMNRYN